MSGWLENIVTFSSIKIEYITKPVCFWNWSMQQNPILYTCIKKFICVEKYLYVRSASLLGFTCFLLFTSTRQLVKYPSWAYTWHNTRYSPLLTLMKYGWDYTKYITYYMKGTLQWTLIFQRDFSMKGSSHIKLIHKMIFNTLYANIVFHIQF